MEKVLTIECTHLNEKEIIRFFWEKEGCMVMTSRNQFYMWRSYSWFIGSTLRIGNDGNSLFILENDGDGRTNMPHCYNVTQSDFKLIKDYLRLW